MREHNARVSAAVRTLCECVTQSLYCEAPRRSEGCVIHHTNVWREERRGVERSGERSGEERRRRNEEKRRGKGERLRWDDQYKCKNIAKCRKQEWSIITKWIIGMNRAHSPERSLTFECYYCFQFREMISVTLSRGIRYFKCERFSGWYFRYGWINWNEVTVLDY